MDNYFIAVVGTHGSGHSSFIQFLRRNYTNCTVKHIFNYTGMTFLDLVELILGFDKAVKDANSFFKNRRIVLDTSLEYIRRVYIPCAYTLKTINLRERDTLLRLSTLVPDPIAFTFVLELDDSNKLYGNCLEINHEIPYEYIVSQCIKFTCSGEHKTVDMRNYLDLDGDERVEKLLKRELKSIKI